MGWFRRSNTQIMERAELPSCPECGVPGQLAYVDIVRQTAELSCQVCSLRWETTPDVAISRR